MKKFIWLAIALCGCGFKQDKVYDRPGEDGWTKVELNKGPNGEVFEFKRITIEGEPFLMVISGGRISLTYLPQTATPQTSSAELIRQLQLRIQELERTSKER